MSTPGRMWRGLWRRFRRDEGSWEEAESGGFRVRPALLRGIALYLSISDGPGSLGCHGANEKKNIELLPPARISESGGFRVRPALLRGIALYLSISDGPGSLGCHGANEKKNIELLPSDGRL